MRQLLVGSIAIASLAATSAFAADLAPRPYTKAPVMVDPGYNWTGFYAGLNGGYSWGRADATFAPGFGAPFTTLFPIAAFGPARTDVNGGVAGGQFGYNWQVNRSWVVGLEGDIQWSGERSSTSLTRVSPNYGSLFNGIPTPLPGPDFNAIASLTSNLAYDLQWFATFRGRAGILVDPQTLLYGTGGLAVGEFKYSAQSTATIQVFNGGIGGTVPAAGSPFVFALQGVSGSDTRLGWTLGAGAERKFTPNWSGKLEYLYMDFGTKTYFAGTVNQTDVRFRDHVLRAGINYEWNPTPIVAKY
jgi:outer membrane immunogenic protein